MLPYVRPALFPQLRTEECHSNRSISRTLYVVAVSASFCSDGRVSWDSEVMQPYSSEGNGVPVEGHPETRELRNHTALRMPPQQRC